MKAIILAAGKGERLKWITKTTPKPMLKYKDKPLLEHNILLCKKYGIEKIYINTHYLSSQIKEYFGNGKKLGVSINYSYEKKLLGTSGALKNFQSSIGNNSFFVIYGDNYSNFNLNLLKNNLETLDAIGVIAFHYRKDVRASGVAEFNENNKIIKFIEKPKPNETDSHWVNAGIYYLKPEIFNYIPNGFSDFGKDIFPVLIKKKIIIGVRKRTNVKAFDTTDMYKKNLEDYNYFEIKKR